MKTSENKLKKQLNVFLKINNKKTQNGAESLPQSCDVPAAQLTLTIRALSSRTHPRGLPPTHSFRGAGAGAERH